MNLFRLRLRAATLSNYACARSRDASDTHGAWLRAALMSVDMPLERGAPRPLFDVRVPLAGNPYRSNYDVRADGSW